MLDSADGDADPYPNQNNKMKRSILKYESITAVWRDKQVQLCFLRGKRGIIFLWEVTHCFYHYCDMPDHVSIFFGDGDRIFVAEPDPHEKYGRQGK